MNEKKMDEVVMDFRAQWSEDFRRAMEKEPSRYCLWIGVEAREIPNVGEYEERFTVVIDDCNSGKSGVAICNPSDKVDVLLGQAIAWARLNNIPLPKQLKPNRIVTLKELKVGKRYCSWLVEPFTVLSKVRHNDMLIYTIYTEATNNYETVRCPIQNTRFMNTKFNIC